MLNIWWRSDGLSGRMKKRKRSSLCGITCSVIINKPAAIHEIICCYWTTLVHSWVHEFNQSLFHADRRQRACFTPTFKSIDSWPKVSALTVAVSDLNEAIPETELLDNSIQKGRAQLSVKARRHRPSRSRYRDSVSSTEGDDSLDRKVSPHLCDITH